MGELKSQKYWRKRPLEERLKNTSIPKKYISATLDNYDQENGSPDVVVYAQHWLKNIESNLDNGIGLYLFGGTGSGKTHIATSILKRAVATSETCGYFITAEQYLETSYAALDDDRYEDESFEADTIYYIDNVYDILVLDGLGTERRQSEFAKKSLTSMISKRYENQLPTIITSDIPQGKLSSIYGNRFSSIVTDCCLTVPFLGEDYRLWRIDGEG